MAATLPSQNFSKSNDSRENDRLAKKCNITDRRIAQPLLQSFRELFSERPNLLLGMICVLLSALLLLLLLLVFYPRSHDDDLSKISREVSRCSTFFLTKLQVRGCYCSIQYRLREDLAAFAKYLESTQQEISRI